MARFFLPPALWTTETALSGDEAKHLSQVLRIRVGENIELFDGEGRRASAEVLSISKQRVEIRLSEITQAPPQRPHITLAQAIPKGKNMDLIVQKSVELGVAVIQPLVTRFTVVQPGEGKAEKWNRVALEACKQCGQDRLPEVAEPFMIAAWLSDNASAATSLKLIASLAPAARPFRQVLNEFPEMEQVILLVGPEGDFSEEETQRALDAGFIPISLGDMVLRTETATLYGLAALRFQYGN